MTLSSRLEGFYKLPPHQRIERLAELTGLDSHDFSVLETGGLTIEQADQLIENVIGLYALPLGIAANFTINNRDYLIPMVIEEPSVVAACSNAARMARLSGGFEAGADEPILTGQVQVLFDSLEDRSRLDAQTLLSRAHERLSAAWTELESLAQAPHPHLIERGGGVRGIEIREFAETPAGPMLVLYLALDTRDAMGANLINTSLENMAPRVAELTGGRVNLRILSNLSDRRRAWASCRVTAEAAGGEAVARSIVEAQALAEVDPYRAATHNKGIMNGIDAVALATGNDWRAIEAGAHAFASRNGMYGPLTRWELSAPGELRGRIELPLAVGIVGGMTRLHRVAQLSLKLMRISSGQELAGVMAAVGLAQNLAALRALAAEGIQQGHMRLHSRRLETENKS